MRLTETDCIIPATNSLPTILFIAVSVHMSEIFTGRGFWRCLRCRSRTHLYFTVISILLKICNSTRILYSTPVVRNAAAGQDSEWQVKARDSSSCSSDLVGEQSCSLRKRDTGSIWGSGLFCRSSSAELLPAHLVSCSGKKSVPILWKSGNPWVMDKCE